MKRIALLCCLSCLSLVSCSVETTAKEDSYSWPSSSIELSVSSSIQLIPSTGLTYELNDSKTGYIVKDKGTCIDKRVLIPDKHLDLPIVEIGESAFKGDEEIESIIIGKNIKKIGVEAFSSCTSLNDVTLNEGIEIIEDEAFYWCSSLKNINLPTSITSIGQLVFFDSGLYRDTANYVDGALLIDHWLCYAQSIRGDFVVPNDVIGLSGKVFNNCSKLTSIDVPLSVTHYGNEPLFDFSDALKSIIISKKANLGSYVSSRFIVDDTFTETERIRYIRRQ